MKIIQGQPNFKESMSALECEPATPDIFNRIYQILLDNDIYLNNEKLDVDAISDWAKEPDKPSYTKSEMELGNVDNTADSDKPVSTAQRQAINEAYENANKFTLQKISELINGAPETLDTLKEIADVIASHKSVTDALDAAIGKKADRYIPLEEGTDLNDITTPGFYYIPEGVGDTIKNKPTGRNYALRVFRIGESGACQEAVAGTTDTESGDSVTWIFTRVLYNGTWGSWTRTYTTNFPPPTPTADDIGAVVKDSAYVVIGKDATATGGFNVAIGNMANAEKSRGVAVGYRANTKNLSAIAIGASTTAAGSDAISVGFMASTDGAYSIAFGGKANNTAERGIAIGLEAKNVGANSVSIGNKANSKRANSVTIGFSAETIGTGSIAIGAEVSAGTEELDPEWYIYSVAIGVNTSALHMNSIAVGGRAHARAANSMALGYEATADGANSTALGKCANTRGARAIAVGTGASVGTDETDTDQEINSIAIGADAKTENLYSVALGEKATTSDTCSTAVGQDAKTKGINSVAVGQGASAETNSTALGRRAITGSINSTALGEDAETSGVDSTAVGCNAESGEDAAAFGFAAKARGLRSVALGFDASTGESDTGVVQLGKNVSALRCAVALSVTSDERDKTDIDLIDKDKALDFIRQINPISYVNNTRSAYEKEESELTETESENFKKYGYRPYDKEAHERGVKKGKRRRVGVSAQQTREALEKIYGSADLANIVNDNLYDAEGIPDGVENAYTVTYESFIPFLIAAIQNLDEKLTESKQKYTKLEESVMREKQIVEQRIKALESSLSCNSSSVGD